MKAPVPPTMFVEEKPQPVVNPPTNLREVDYSEYEWMEHIDEFDKEVLRVLEEEEAVLETYFYEYFDCDDFDDDDYLGDDDDDEYNQYDLVDSDVCLFSDPKNDDCLIEQFSVLNVSKLNPEAPEFQPKLS